MSNSTESLSLHMTVYIRPENLGKFWEAFKPLYDNVIAEPECTFFEVYQSPEDPGTISWVENW
jgi:quinol monooxygenase YgiN